MQSYYVEAAYGQALELIAMGEDRETTRDTLIELYPFVSVDQVNDLVEDALRDALKQGIEREDIDPTWFE